MDANLGLNLETRATIARAAAGDLAAQRLMAETNLKGRERARAGGGRADYVGLEGLLWSRLAAAQGDESDAMRLVTALCAVAQDFGEQGEQAAARNLGGEGIAVLRSLVAAGHEPAVRVFGETAHELAPALIQRSTTIIEEEVRAKADLVAQAKA